MQGVAKPIPLFWCERWDVKKSGNGGGEKGSFKKEIHNITFSNIKITTEITRNIHNECYGLFFFVCTFNYI